MNGLRVRGFNRREFLAGASAISATSLLGLSRTAAAETRPEVTTIRLVGTPSICIAPQYVAEELLRVEGFENVQYVADTIEVGTSRPVALGEADINMSFVGPLLVRMGTDQPIVVLAGVHVGCYELFGNSGIKALRDLRGKTVSVPGLGSTHHVFLSSMLAYVGIDPRKDVRWVTTQTPVDAMHLFVEGKVDAYLGFPPQPQELRAKKIGRVIVNTAVDRPWSQYFCCMVTANREFVARYPVATKRALRAILKAADICAQEPEWAARYMVKKGYGANYDFALEVVKEVSYNTWRTYEPEDTLRFHALRLQEVGMIKSSPQKLIAQGTDWRFLNELKKELKA